MTAVRLGAGLIAKTDREFKTRPSIMRGFASRTKGFSGAAIALTAAGQVFVE
jgi:hypothetical protein